MCYVTTTAVFNYTASLTHFQRKLMYIKCLQYVCHQTLDNWFTAMILWQCLLICLFMPNVFHPTDILHKTISSH